MTFDKRRIDQLHDEAMTKAQESMLARFNGNAADVERLNREAFELELQAAMLLKDAFEYEPTRSVYFRSAATLARNLGCYWEAACLASLGLSGNPPDEIAMELREVLASAYETIQKDIQSKTQRRVARRGNMARVNTPENPDDNSAVSAGASDPSIRKLGTPIKARKDNRALRKEIAQDEIYGTLVFADGTHRRGMNAIQIRDASNALHRVFVDKKSIDSIVQTLWNKHVVITIKKDDGEFVLKKICHDKEKVR